MQIKEIMRREIAGVQADDPVSRASAKMKAHDIGVLPVFRGDDMVGMLTDRDITVKAVAEGKSFQSVTTEETMIPDVIACQEDDDPVKAALIMKENKIRRLLVENNDGRVTGVISLGDIAHELSRRMAEVVVKGASES